MNKIEIPEFLKEMSEQMNTQDNRITADPIWMVCYDKAHVTAHGYEDYTEYAVTGDGEYSIVFSTEDGSSTDEEYARVYLLENYPEYCDEWMAKNEREFVDFDFSSETCDLPEGVEEYHMVRRQEVVKAHLTEADAKWFIQRKQHDYPKLYTYVFSMCYCPQMIELRQWILSLTKATQTNKGE